MGVLQRHHIFGVRRKKNLSVVLEGAELDQ